MTRSDPIPPRRGAAREEAILRATVELVAELGYDGVTVDGIASRARASKATMYRRWASKAELVAAALRNAAEGRSTPTVDTGTVRGDLLMVVGEIAAAAGDGNGPSLVSLAEPMRRDPELRALIRSQIRGRAEYEARQLAERAASRGEPVSRTASLLAVELAIAYSLLAVVLDGERPDEADMARLVDELLLPHLTLSPRGDSTSPTTLEASP